MHHHLSTGTDGDSYRVVFIGNSITLHGLTDYWWGEWGMAASDADHDYVHQTVTELGRKYRVNADVLNFAVWETNGHDHGINPHSKYVIF